MPVLSHDVFTDQPGSGPFVIFPTHAHQILSNCIHILGTSVLAYCFARRTENDRFTSWIWWSNLTWARLLIILVFLDSWFFLAFSGVLVNGVGLSYSVPVCSLGIFGCIFFYAGSKVRGLTYLFLVERVWVVCSAGKSITRRESLIYKGCVVIVAGYTAIVVVLILGRYTNIRDDGVCIIGLHSFASIPLLTYDLIINILLTSMFLWFLYREQSIGARLRRLARRTAFAAAIALTTSCVNILILSLLEGKQLGWVCLSSCAADVTVNALVLFWVTGGATREPYWQGAAWDHNKEAAALADPQDLPPLNFPISFVADPELGLSRTRTVEASHHSDAHTPNHNHNNPRNQNQSRWQSQGGGSSNDTEKGRTNRNNEARSRATVGNGGTGDLESDDATSVSRGNENIEWDTADSVSSSSGNTQLNLEGEDDEKEDIKNMDRVRDKARDRESAVHSWRLTLDLDLDLELELQRQMQMQRQPLSHPQPFLQVLQAEQSEPDSPATHETEANSCARLTGQKQTASPTSEEGASTSTSTIASRQRQARSNGGRKRRKDQYKKQRRKQWYAYMHTHTHARPRRGQEVQERQRQTQIPAESTHSRPRSRSHSWQRQERRPTSSPATLPHSSDPPTTPNGAVATTEASEASPHIEPLPPLSPSPSHPVLQQRTQARTRRAVVESRSHSDSLVRHVPISELEWVSGTTGPGRPRLSQ